MTEAHIGIILAIGALITTVGVVLRKNATPSDQAKRRSPKPPE